MPRHSRALSPAFTRHWTAVAVSNLGDGVTLAAGPLLVATLTTDPLAVSAALFAQQLPWLLFALTGGALADRLPRRTLVVAGNTVRAATIGGLALVIAAGTPALWQLYLVSFLFGTIETVADTAHSALIVDSVPADRLGRANAGCTSRPCSTTSSRGHRSARCCSGWRRRCRSGCTPPRARSRH